MKKTFYVEVKHTLEKRWNVEVNEDSAEEALQEVKRMINDGSGTVCAEFARNPTHWEETETTGQVLEEDILYC
jgi:broad-specificity NMP kinase